MTYVDQSKIQTLFNAQTVDDGQMKENSMKRFVKFRKKYV